MATGPKKSRPPVRLQVGALRVSRGARPAKQFLTREVNATFRQWSKKLAKVIKSVENTTPAALNFAVEPIWEDSQNIVPVDTEALRDSGYVGAVKRGKSVELEIGYGKGGRPRYAVFVHEVQARHDAPTQWKFLEVPIRRGLKEVGPRIRWYLAFER